MRAVDCALAAALALALASTARALPRFDDGEDIYVEDQLQRLDPAGRSKKSVEASGPAANEFVPVTVDGVKLKNEGDARGEKKSAGASRSDVNSFGPPVAVAESKNESGAKETKKEANVDGSQKSIDDVPEGSGPPVDGGDWPRRPRQNFDDPPVLTMSYSPYFRTFGAAGVTREQSDAEQQATLAAGGMNGKCDKHGCIGGVAGGAGAGPYVHPPSPLKQLKQLVPNIISAITAILPPPAPPTPAAGPGSGPGLGGSGLGPGLGGSGLGPGHGGPGPGPGLSPGLAGHKQYGANPHKGSGLIYSKRIIILPPGGVGFGHGPSIEDYPDFPPTSRFPVYPELPPPPPPAFDAFYPPPSGPPPLFVDAAGRVWAFGYPPVPPPAQRPLFTAPGQDPSPEAPPERPAEELSARSGESGPPASVGRLRADVDAELARIEALERAMNLPAAAEKDS